MPALPHRYLRLRQVCLVAPQLAPAVAAVQATLGLDPCFRDPAVARFGLENALFALGESFLEIVAPLRPDPQGETAAGRFLARSGGVGGYMLIFDCDDPAAYRRRADAQGVRIAFTIEHSGYHGLQLHPRDCRATMLEFDHTDGGEALDGPYHPAGPHWQAGRRPDRVQALLQAEVCSPDAAGLARHWAALMDVAVEAGADGVQRLALDFGRLAIAPAAAGTPEHLAALRLQVADPVAVLAAAAGAGLAVQDGRFALCGVWLAPVAAATASAHAATVATAAGAAAVRGAAR